MDKYSTVIRLMLYLGSLDIDEFYETLKYTSLSISNLIETKCNYTASAICYLFSTEFVRYVDSSDINQFSKNKLYAIDLQGFIHEEDHIRNMSHVGHSFVLYFDKDQWNIIDSYIGQRGLLIRPVQLDELYSFLNSEFDIDHWNKIFHCHEDKGLTIRFTKNIYEYNFEDNLENRYSQLIKDCINKFETDEDGKSDEYITLLDENCDLEEAAKYLKSL